MGRIIFKSMSICGHNESINKIHSLIHKMFTEEKTNDNLKMGIVTPIYQAANSFSSFYIHPDCGKDGRDISNKYDEFRAKIIVKIYEINAEIGYNSINYCLVNFGGDLDYAEIIDTNTY